MTKKIAALGADLVAKKGGAGVTVGAPQRSAPAVVTDGETKPFNFRVSADFKREWLIYAAERGMTNVAVLRAAFAALKEKDGQ